jgi:hypothetical protein
LIVLFIVEKDFDADHCRRVRRQTHDNLSKCFLPRASVMLPPRLAALWQILLSH